MMAARRSSLDSFAAVFMNASSLDILVSVYSLTKHASRGLSKKRARSASKGEPHTLACAAGSVFSVVILAHGLPQAQSGDFPISVGIPDGFDLARAARPQLPEQRRSHRQSDRRQRPDYFRAVPGQAQPE